MGEAFRLHGLTTIPQSAHWAPVLVDSLHSRPDVKTDKIGIIGWSLGELQKGRLARKGSNPVPHYLEHVQWVWGTPTMEASWR